MNKEEIDKWLDEEYGCSYTRLEELHDFYFEKYCNFKEEIKQLKERINTYENPEDLTLMFMYCDEIKKDTIKELENKNSILMENLIRSKTKYNNDKARYRRKAKMYRERINNAVEYIEDKLKIYPEGLVGKHLGQEFLKDILDLLKGDKE